MMVRLRIADPPAGASWTRIYGVEILCGIGFTMSLLIGNFAFADAPHAMDTVNIGVFSGSILAGAAG